MERYYTTGEFARMAHVTIRTIRYYDKKGILKPSFVNQSGDRMYSDEDFLKLQKILSLKYLGFSLEEIGNMTIHDTGEDILKSLKMQIGLIRKKMENLEQMEKALENTMQVLEETNQIDWNEILNLIHLTDMEKLLVEQYKNGENLNIRISLHEKYSENRQGWFPWLYDQIDLDSAAGVLEVGCGNGQLWKSAKMEELKRRDIILTDLSDGMVRDAKENLGKELAKQFRFCTCDCQELPFADEQFDRVIANHVLFYLQNLGKGLQEISRVLKKDGIFICSTYGSGHMREITELVQEFDPRINLSEVALYKIFGLDQGEKLLSPCFSKVEKRLYKDRLLVDRSEPLLDYILSCHGNQNEYLYPRQQEFREFLEEKIQKNRGISITKEAGVFICRK
ncbi:MAG: MerR family transcriptional regulator [Fusicatenibacter sp.]|nr:MerR family transcriptional regulator [Fusicatenibacter sp.]